jgi:hypothetical protein
MLAGLNLSPRDYPQVSPKSNDLEHHGYGNPQNILDKPQLQQPIGMDKRQVKTKDMDSKVMPPMQQRSPLPNIVQMTQGPPMPQFQQRNEYIPPIYSRQGNIQYTQPIMKPSIQVLPQDIKNMFPNQFKKDSIIKIPDLQHIDMGMNQQMQMHNQIQPMQMQQQMHTQQQMQMMPQMNQQQLQNPQIYPYSGQKPMQKEVLKQILSKKKRYGGFDQVTTGTKRDREESEESKKQKHFLSSNSVQLLKEWFYDHLDHPYPSADQKEDLSKRTGLTYLQVSNWFTNTRKRVWAPSMRTLMQKGGENGTMEGDEGEEDMQPQEQSQQQNLNPMQQQPQIPQLPKLGMPLSPDNTSQSGEPSHVGLQGGKLEPFESNWEQK